jgi:ankyrin repeat protein
MWRKWYLRIAGGAVVVVFLASLIVGLSHRQRGLERQLVIACEEGDAARVHRLLEAGVDANAIVRVDSGDLMWWYHETFLPGDRMTMRTPAICAAAMRGRTDLVDDLLAHGANPNFTDPIGATAIRYAADGGNVVMIRHLLDHGATPMLVYKDGHIPLDEALSPALKAQLALQR